MLKHILIFFTILIICHSGNSSAMPREHDEEDLRISKKTPTIISSIRLDQLIQPNKPKMGVMTLCFAKQKKSVFDHVSLVFEMFHPMKNPNEISLIMVHYAGVNDLCDKNLRPKIENHLDTLKLAHRYKTGSLNRPNTTVYVSGPHQKYASWIIPNDMLIKGLEEVENDILEDKANVYTCVKYVSKLMRTVGLKRVNFGLWTERAENLKCLVDDYIEPKPNIKYSL